MLVPKELSDEEAGEASRIWSLLEQDGVVLQTNVGWVIAMAGLGLTLSEVDVGVSAQEVGLCSEAPLR